MKRAALIISILFHPLMVMNMGLFVILFIHPYYRAKYYDTQVYTLSGFILLHTLFFPLLGMLLLKYFKVIDSLHLYDRKERTIPFVMTLSFFLVTCYNLYTNDITGLPFIFMVGCSIALALNLVINFFFKISSHSIAVAGLCGMLLACLTVGGSGELLFITTLSVIAAGLVGSARLVLHAHVRKDIYWGYFVGFITLFLITILYGI